MATRKINLKAGKLGQRARLGPKEEDHKRVWKWLGRTGRRKFLKSIGTPEYMLESHWEYLDRKLGEMNLNSRGRTEAMSILFNNRMPDQKNIPDGDHQKYRDQAAEDVSKMEGLFNQMFDQKDYFTKDRQAEY